jgi:hypothetical protein
MGLVPVVGAIPGSPAEAVPTSNLAVVSQQDGGCATKDQILLANPLDGSLATGNQPGKPVTTWGPLNEAKPIDFNRKIVGLWAGHSDGRLAGVGVYDRATHTWPIQFALPTTLAKGGPHSVARLPGDYFAVAHVGGITGTSVNGAVLLFDRNGILKDTEGLVSAHGVEWDEARKKLFAIGYDYVKSYELVGEDLRPETSWTLPGTVRNGHDLRRKRTDTKFLVTGNTEEWTFDPAVAGSAAFTAFTKDGGADWGNGVKSLDQGFDGVTLQAFHNSEWFFFSNRGPEQADFCMAPYKFRWIYAAGTPVYNEEEAPAEQAATQPAEPFLWAQKRVSTTDMKPVDDIWLGGATNTTADAAYDIVDRAADNGDTPFIKFYHWGDDGSPTMGNFGAATTTQINGWKSYAHKIATALGSRPGYIVMEPEYDTNMSSTNGACSSKFETAMKEIVVDLKNTAENLVIINQSSFWADSASPYTCYADTAKTMHAQGFLIHVSNKDPNCTWRTSNYDGPYTGGEDATKSLEIVAKAKRKAYLTRQAFGTDRAFLSDLAVTSCGWGGQHQADIFDRLADAIPALYKDEGLRGALIRTGGPSENQRYLGVNNEGGFVWSSQSATRINAAYGEIQTFLQSISGTNPTFDAAATAPSSVGAGQEVPINVTVTNTGGSLASGHIKVEVRNSANSIVASTSFATSWSTGQPQSRTWNWAGTSTVGTYTVHIGVFSSDWQTMYDWTSNAATFTVSSTGPPAFTSSASASPASIAAGATTTISATVNNTGSTLTNGEVAIEVYAPNGQLAHRGLSTGQTINGGASANYQTTWTAPSDAAGTYPVAVVVTGASGTPVYHSNGNATSVTVSSATFTSTGSVDKPVVLPGAGMTFTANVTNNGGPVTGAEIRLSARDAAGTVVGLQTLTGQTLLGAGATSTFTWNWTTPTTKGAYTLRIGVYTTGGASVLHWNPGASSVAVADASLTSGVDATPSTVAPGGTTTLKLTVTNVGAHLDNTNVALDIFNSAGTKIAQVPTNGQSGQTFAHGETKTYSWTWTAPTTLGTYTVKAGVWHSSWTPTYHYNQTADTVTVAEPAFTSSAFASPSNPTVGSTVTITATLTNTGGALADGRVAVRVYDSAGGVARDCASSGQNIANGATATYTCTWVPVATGTFTVKIGVWHSSWTPTYHWNNGAATINVGGTTFQPSFDVGDGANTWWIEVYTASDVTAVDVVGKDGQFYKSLTKQSWGAWTATATSEMPAGSLVRFIARRSSDGATAGSNNFLWLQAEPTTDPGWVCSITKGSGASTTWVEALACAGATNVEVKVGSGAFTGLTYSAASGKWGKAMNVATGTKVVFRATSSSGARAYSAIITW